MKKNYLKSCPSKKPAKKPVKKSAAQLREGKIAKILSKVSEICNYAIDNLCTQPAQFEELEWMLRNAIN